MVDTKLTKSIGEHHVAAVLARRGWAPALTRDGLERTDILAVQSNGAGRRMVEVQVKTARAASWESTNWQLGTKSQVRSLHERELFVLVAVPNDDAVAPRSFVVPRSHVAAAAWIQHMDWLTDPRVETGRRTTPIDRARVYLPTFAAYEDRWDLLLIDESEAAVLLPRRIRELAQEVRVGLPVDHPWHTVLPEW